jgi:hypothetical protein
MAAGVLSQHDVVSGNAHSLWSQYFIGLLVGQHAVLVDARFVQESVAAYDGLVQRRGLANDGIDRLAGAADLGGVQAGEGNLR